MGRPGVEAPVQRSIVLSELYQSHTNLEETFSLQCFIGFN